jgi:DNA polymerase (family 10)
MTNSEISKILSEIGEYLEMQGIAFKPRAYEKAAEAVASLSVEVRDIYKKSGLKAVEEIPGVGVSIAEKIEELLKTGKLKYYEQLKKKTPVDLSALTSVEGLGPRKIKILYQQLGIKNIEDLERAAKAGKIAKLEGFGEKSEENILKGIGFVRSSGGRMLLGEVLPVVRSIVGRLQKLKEIERVEVAGSIRRYKETIGDGDILAISSHPKPVMDFFVSMPEVANVSAHGETKSAIKLKNGLDVDLRVLPKESYGAALNYFTGSKDHNVALRQLAIKKGYKLSEYGLFKGERRIAGKTEEEIYEKLGLQYIPPEMREMAGELDLAAVGKLPHLIGYGDLKGDLQVQTNWTDGNDSIEEMAGSAMEYGLEYIVITDHTKRLAMTHGLDEKRIKRQWEEIDEENKKLKIKNKKFRILKGTECDILKDGSLDLPDDILEKLDVVGASVHSLFNLSKKEQTARIIKAMENPHVDIIFHPTGRLINKRPAYEVDIDEIIKAAKRTGTVLEIDAFPDRLDLRDEHIRRCVEAGVKMAIDSDAHAKYHFGVLEFGIAQARRGWATKYDIVNAWPIEKMLDFLK